MNRKPPIPLADRLIQRVRNHPVGAALVLTVGAILLLSQVTGASGSLIELFQTKILGRPSDAASRVELCQLEAPLIVQLDRTKKAFDLWIRPDRALEKTIRDGNLGARQLLIDKAALVPAELQDAQRRLIEHYDRWFEEYDRQRVENGDKPMDPYVFVGPQGFGFPRDAEMLFRTRRDSLLRRLGAGGCV